MIHIKTIKMLCSIVAVEFAMPFIARQTISQPASAVAAHSAAPHDHTDLDVTELSRNIPMHYRLIELGPLRGSSYGYAINDSGQVVGNSRGVIFIWQAGVIRELTSLPDTIESQPCDINTRGYVVGSAGNPGPSTAIVWRNGKMGRLFADARRSSAQAINDKNQIVGDMTVGTDISPNGIQHAFLWKQGQIIDLGTLAGGDSHAMGINAKGQIVGTSDWQNVTHGFLWENGKMHDLGTLGGAQTEAYGINDNAQVVGASDTKAGVSHAFLWEKGDMHDLGSPGPGYCVALRINKKGIAVGIWSPSGPGFQGSRALVWIDRKVYDLNDLIQAGSGWVLEGGHDINDKGEIVGHGKHNGRTCAFLLVPISRNIR
jgi:probable HAF family extracellular repeat protein